MNPLAPPPPPHDEAAEEAAWAALRARWEDGSAHRAWLDGFRDLPGLARAGARYRAVLEAHPGDGPAQRGREEVLRRATAVALAAGPRAVPAREPSPGPKRALVLALVVLFLGAAVAALLGLLRSGAVR